MPYVPGNAAEGYCLECKRDTVQTVLEVEGLQVRLVRCEKCGTEGPLRMPRHKTKAGLRAALQKKATPGTKKRRTRKPKEDPGQTFRQLLQGKDISAAIDYSVKAQLEEGSVLKHKSFGIGVVTAIVESNKATILFEDGPRTMIFGRS
ncbi:MAG: hypothetical protein JXX29_12565 [Deltaproteobacteria bacterium]|nr:hypothetical protein [Deltaproteobacteria bacterium]MBN2672508.1 hypothetical protein [Deltaproteobacteria bacterium]